MSKRQIIMILGVLVAVIQFLGFPPEWNKFFTFVCGIVIIGIAYRVAPKVRTEDKKAMPYEDYKREDDKKIETGSSMMNISPTDAAVITSTNTLLTE